MTTPPNLPDSTTIAGFAGWIAAVISSTLFVLERFFGRRDEIARSTIELLRDERSELKAKIDRLEQDAEDREAGSRERERERDDRIEALEQTIDEILAQVSTSALCAIAPNCPNRVTPADRRSVVHNDAGLESA